MRCGVELSAQVKELGDELHEAERLSQKRVLLSLAGFRELAEVKDLQKRRRSEAGRSSGA